MKSSVFRLFTILFCVGLIAALGCGGGPAAIPKAFSTYNAKDGTFQCQAPDGWEIEGGGGKASPAWAHFSSGSADIRITADVSGSLMGDLMGGRNPDDETPPELEAVHQLHEQGKEPAEKDYSDYKETAPPAEIDIPLGPARFTEFTASSSFGTPLHGYRVTALAKDRRVTVVCVGEEDQWSKLQPAFDQVIKSLKRGEAR